jgi:hypothetical protein
MAIAIKPNAPTKSMGSSSIKEFSTPQQLTRLVESGQKPVKNIGKAVALAPSFSLDYSVCVSSHNLFTEKETLAFEAPM